MSVPLFRTISVGPLLLKMLQKELSLQMVLILVLILFTLCQGQQQQQLHRLPQHQHVQKPQPKSQVQLSGKALTTAEANKIMMDNQIKAYKKMKSIHLKKEEERKKLNDEGGLTSEQLRQKHLREEAQATRAKHLRSETEFIKEDSDLAPEIQQLRKLFRSRARNTTDPTRWEVVEATLSKAAGIYRHEHPLLKERPELQHSIFMVMIHYGTKEENQHYKVYFKNFLCFTRHYNIKLVVYVSYHSHSGDLQKEIEELQAMGLLVLTYPDSLFWEIVSTKTSPILGGRGFAEYNRPHPSFKGYGALVMLIPVLEALEHGYNVIFMDVDVALVQDPVPYITKGTADMVFSQENRHCVEFYSTSYPEHYDFFTQEANTGVMYLRATSNTRYSFRRFLEHIVEFNYVNDQRGLNRFYLQLLFEPNCNDAGKWKGYTPSQVVPHGVEDAEAFIRDSKGTFCMLEEIAFQNGIISVGCPMKKLFRDDYILEMVRHGSRVNVSKLASPQYARFPVTVHVNYADKKTHELTVRGLWLLRANYDQIVGNDFCIPYNISRTYYGAHNWQQELADIEASRAYIKTNALKNNTAVKTPSDATVYVVRVEPVKEQTTNRTSNHIVQIDGKGMFVERHAIPNGATFMALFGEDWGRIQTVPTAVMMEIPVGEPIPSAERR